MSAALNARIGRSTPAPAWNIDHSVSERRLRSLHRRYVGALLVAGILSVSGYVVLSAPSAQSCLTSATSR